MGKFKTHAVMMQLHGCVHYDPGQRLTFVIALIEYEFEMIVEKDLKP